jgi:hypothetical protein
MMAVFGNKTKDGNFVVNFSSVQDGVPGIPAGLAIHVIADDESLTIESRLKRASDVVHLPYKQITGFARKTDREILTITKQKSVVGRAAVGGLLLGPLGAVIGGMDGQGAKRNKKIEIRTFFIINYISSGGETAVLLFQVVGATLGLPKFISLLTEKTGIVQSRERTL